MFLAFAQLTVGQVVENSEAFTSLIGTGFRAGEKFRILLVGTVSAQAEHIKTGSRVWIHKGGGFRTEGSYC